MSMYEVSKLRLNAVVNISGYRHMIRAPTYRVVHDFSNGGIQAGHGAWIHQRLESRTFSRSLP